MTYTKYPWTAGKTTPINATNLNHIEDGIYDAHEMATGRGATIVVAANDSTTLEKQQADVVCDGTGDQTDIVDVCTSDRTIVFLPGTYDISATPSIYKKVNLHLLGYGATFKGSGTADRLLEFSRADNTTVKGLIFDSPETSNKGVIVYGRRADPADDLAFGVTFRNCVFQDYGLQIAVDYGGYYTSDVVVDSCRFYDTTGYGINLAAQCRSIRITNNYFKTIALNAIAVYGGAQDVVVTGNQVYDSLHSGIAVSPSHRVVISNNIVTGTVGEGIYIEESGIEIEYNESHGDLINLTNADKVGYDIIVSDNILYANTYGIQTRTAGGGSSIRCHDLIIHHNRCYNNEYGCKIDNCDDSIIDHNIFDGNTTIDFVLGANVSGLLIRDNIGYITENSGTSTLVSGTTSIAVNHGLDVTPVIGDIIVTPIEAWGNMTQFYIGNYTSTQFTIYANINPGQDVDFAWKAIAL